MKLMQRFRFATMVSLVFFAYTSIAQMLSGEALITALQGGGYVIVMRHASSPRQAPDVETANPDNVNRERQLDEPGRRDAIAMGVPYGGRWFPSLKSKAVQPTGLWKQPVWRVFPMSRSMKNEEIGTCGARGKRMQLGFEKEWLILPDRGISC